MRSKCKKHAKAKKSESTDSISNFKKSKLDFRELSEIDYDIYRFFRL